MAKIKIKKDDRTRECEEADFAYFSQQGFSKVAAEKKAPAKKADKKD